jgi:hypothetical protein
MMSNAKGIVRPYVAGTDIQPGSSVNQGDGNKVILNNGLAFVGIYPFEGNEPKKAGEGIPITLTGVVKVRVSSAVIAGRRAVQGTQSGSIVMISTNAGRYETIGIFLESGAVNEYVDMLICRDQVSV